MYSNSIIQDTLKFLENETEWEERYKGYIEQLSVRRNLSRRPFNTPCECMLYSSISQYSGYNYDLRFLGQSIATIVVNQETNAVTLYPKSTNCCFEKYKDHNFQPSENGYSWQQKKAKEFRSFFKEYYHTPHGTRLKSPEHKLENLVLKELSKRSGQEKALPNIRPITLYNLFFQMPTPLAASKHKEVKFTGHHGGSIDIMARAIRRNGEYRLCVMELKDQNKKSESQADAMKQAVVYATFIAKLLRSESGEKWWNFFMGHTQGTNDSQTISAMPSTLDIDVVTVMPKGNSATWAEEDLPIQTDSAQLIATLHCYTLYYDEDTYNKSQQFLFSGSYPEQLKPYTK
jgi:hypothetical protein